MDTLSKDTLKDDYNIIISSLTANQTSLTNSQTLISNNIENIDDQILSLDASMTAIFAIVDELKNADNVLSSNISEIQASIKTLLADMLAVNNKLGLLTSAPTPTATDPNPINLHSNGVTLVAGPSAVTGQSYDYNGTDYLIVNNETIRDNDNKTRNIVTTRVTSMAGLFFEMRSFNGDIKNCDTAAVTDMSLMFGEARAFNGNISSWNTAAVTNMGNMFYEASAFDQDINKKKVTVDGLTYTAWNTAAVIDIDYMFCGTPFNQDLTDWCVTNITTEPDFFSTNSALTNANKPVWGTCPTAFSLNITATSSAEYTLSGTDRNGNISGSNPNLTFNVGDTISFVVNASGHPFYLKTTAGKGNAISGVANNGSESATASWTPTAAGTFYYQCSLQGGMVGTITVQ